MPPADSPGPRDDRATWLRQPGRHRILLAAERVFVADGVPGARMDAIAAEAGVARSHVYYHFKGKDEILQALVELRTGDLLAAKDAVLAGADESDPGHLRAAIERVMVPHRDFLRLVLAESVRRPEGAAPFAAIVTALLDDTVERFAALGHDVAGRRAEIFYLLVVPALFAVAVDGLAVGVAEPGEVAPLLQAASDRLFGEG